MGSAGTEYHPLLLARAGGTLVVLRLGETKDLYIFQYELVNPYPDRTLRSVELMHADHYDVGILLLAMSVLPVND